MNWLEDWFLRWFYTHYKTHLGYPLMIRHRWGAPRWTYIDRYGVAFELRETGNHEGTPLMITRKEEM